MSGALYLAWRYVLYHRVKTLILVVSLTVSMVLPLATHLLIERYDQQLRARATKTPLLIGAPGKRFDLVLKALYFTDAQVDSVHMSDVEELRAGSWGTPIPLELSYTVQRGEFPIVGTTLDYFGFRKLRVAEGTLPLRLGDTVLGADLARELDLGPGDHIFSDQRQLYDITQTYPLKMKIVGVLKKAGTPDDLAAFVDLKTTWIIAGISHGHQDVVRPDIDPAMIMQRDEEGVVTNPGIVEYNEVTDENIDSFHTHAQPEELPLSAIIVLPDSPKAATILKAEYQRLDRAQRMLVPADVVDELMARVIRVRRLFDACFATIAFATLLFLVLVVLLSARLRAREMEIMSHIGCSRWTAFNLHATELGIVLAFSVALSGVIAGLVVACVPQLAHIL